MRKSYKILTIVLCVVLLFALAATAISAATSPTYTKPAAATYHKNGNARDFEGDTKAYDSIGKFVSSKVVLGSNTYNRITNQQADGSFNFSTTNQMNQLPNPYISILERDYITVEIDIMADKYTNGTDLISIEQYNALSETAKEAYFPAFAESWFYWETSGGGWTWTNASSVHVRRIGGKWYLCAGTGTATTYPLPEEAGVWTHLSFVVKVGNTTTYIQDGVEKTSSYAEYKKIKNSVTFVKTAVSETEGFLYVDGEYAFKIPGFAAADRTDDTAAAPTFKYGQIKTGHDTSTKLQHPVSFGLDNTAVYYYNSTYTGPLAESVANRTSIKYNTDTVFNVDYPYPDGYYTAASVIYPDGAEYKFQTYEAALRAVVNNSMLVLNDNATMDCLPNCEFVVDTKGYTFTMSPDAAYVCEYAGEGTYYEVRKATEAEYGTIVWEDGKGTVTKVIGGLKPEYKVPLDVITSGSSAKMISGWTTRKGSIVAEDNYKSIAGETLTLYPVYSKVAFATYDADGKVIAGYKNPADIVKVINGAQIGSLYIKLYADINIDSFGIAPNQCPFSINDIDFTLDLNGYRLSRFDHYANQTAMFDVAAGVQANIYVFSSRAGGEILSIRADASGNNGGGTLFYNHSIYTTYTFGDGTQNLTVLMPQLVYNLTPVSVPNYKNGIYTKVYINGGTYNGIHSQSDGFIFTYGGTLYFEAKDATFIGNNPSGSRTLLSLFCGHSSRNGQIIGSIDNCKIRAKMLTYAVASNAELPSKITFTNTDIILDSTQAAKTNLTYVFGENVRTNSTSLLPENNASVVIADKCAGVSVQDTIAVNTYSYKLKFVKGDDGVYRINKDTIVPVAFNKEATSIYTVYGPDSMVKIQWFDANKVLISESYALVGTTATFEGDTSTLLGERINEYLSYSFKGWKKIDGSESMTVTPGGTNIFIADCTGAPVADIKASYNLATNTNFFFHFYLPAINGIEITSVVINGTEVVGTEAYKGVSIDGVNYEQTTYIPGATEVGALSHVITFTYDGTTYTQEFNLTMNSYFKGILEGNYADIEKQLIATALKYCNSVYEYVNGTTHADYDELLSEYEIYVKWVSSKTLRADAEKNLDAISEYVTDAVFAIGDAFKPMFGFKVAQGVTEVNFSNTSTVTGETVNYTVVADAVYGDVLAGTDACIPVADIRETITITVGEATGTFNLASYIVYIQTQEMTAENIAAINLCKAIYAYSLASYEYKTAN